MFHNLSKCVKLFPSSVWFKVFVRKSCQCIRCNFQNPFMVSLSLWFMGFIWIMLIDFLALSLLLKLDFLLHSWIHLLMAYLEFLQHPHKWDWAMALFCCLFWGFFAFHPSLVMKLGSVGINKINQGPLSFSTDLNPFPSVSLSVP